VPVTNARYALNAANARWGSSTTRSTAPTRCRAARPPSPATIPRAARRSSPGRASSSTRSFPLAGGSHADAAGLCGRGRRACRHAQGRPQDRPARAGPVRRPSRARPPRRHPSCSSTTACTPRSSSTARAASAATTRPASPMSCWKRRSPPSGLRGFGRLRRRRRQGRRLRNWLGLMKGDLADTFDKGGKTDDAQAQRRPRLHRAGRLALQVLHGRSLLLVRNVGHLMTNPTPCAERRGSPEGILDAMVTSAHRAARSARKGRAQRTAAPARSISSSRRCTARRKSPSPCELFGRVEDALGPARNTLKMGIMDEERRTTVNLKECIRAAKERVVLHQHRLPRPHRRRDPHLDGSRPDGPQGRHEARRPGSRPTRTGTSTSAWPAACRPRADRQGHVGHARPDGGDAGAEDRPPAAGANTAWVPSPTAATLHATHYHRSTCSPCRTSSPGAARARSRRHPDHPARRPAELVAGGHSAASSTTTRRAFSAMSCAGSIRASAARRCRTSTTSA
jgi:malate synthase